MTAVAAHPPVAANAAALVSGARARAAVTTPAGRFRGLATPAMQAFLGIPYAQPPVGALRWQPPQPLPVVDPSKTTNATAFAPHCAQPAGAFGQASTSEDCLYLNVFTPPSAAPGAKLPVMVWIHGGAFTTGESDDYNPDRLVPHGVIVVTLNYRLGLLGFFAQPALDAEGHAAIDYGLMDQQAAMRWVHANIASFGGDPRRVTIFGESAGGLSVYSQLSSPGAAGLFSAAIDESGAYQLALPTRGQSEAAGTATAAQLGCANQTAACLRAVPVTTLLATEGSMTVPSVDGTVLPRSPDAAFATGHFHHVPLVNGSNHDEYRLFVAAEFDLTPGGPITANEYEPLIAASLGSAAAQAVVAQYPLSAYSSPDVAFATVVTDYIFACPAYGVDETISRAAPVFSYEFADENAPEPYLPPVSFPYAAAHASEIQFLWDRFNAANPPLTQDETTLANTMTAYWTQFAVAHQPSVGGAPLWFPFFGPVTATQTLVPPTPQVSLGFSAEHKCPFWFALASAASPSLQHVRDASRAYRANRAPHR